MLEALLAEGARDPVSLQASRPQEGGPSELADSLGAGDEGFERIDDRAAVALALRTLTERERHVLELRFGRDMTQSEIAAEIGVSQMQVSRLLRRAIDGMRAVAGGEGDS